MATLVTWSQYRETIADRSSLFCELAEAWPIGAPRTPPSSTANPGSASAAPAPDRTGSTNLGLAIAERLAIASGGSLVRARSPMGGALVTLTLGPAGD